MPSNEQRRQAAKRKLERQIARRAQQAKRRRQVATITAAVVVIVVIVGVVFLTTRHTSTNTNTAAAASPPPPAAPTVVPGMCTFTRTPDQPPSKPVDPPPDGQVPTQASVAMTLRTDQGAIPLILDRAQAPCNVASSVHLATAKFYDGSPCHRLTTGAGLKVLQCGDPTGKGTGGPGYTTPDENPTNLQPSPQGPGTSIYPRGAVAMANTGQPNSGGSQFFLVYADSTLPPHYALIGTISAEGLAVIDKVAAAGDDGSNGAGDGKPRLPITIQQAVVTADASSSANPPSSTP